VVASLLGTLDFDAHLGRLRTVYGERRDTMLAALAATMPAGARWTEPEGGLFVWLELPPGVRDDDLFAAAVKSGVAVVPGGGFFVGAPRHGFVRLNYSNQKPAAITSGVARLSAAMTTLTDGARVMT
jgi:2-aminoadipate transaminase